MRGNAFCVIELDFIFKAHKVPRNNNKKKLLELQGRAAAQNRLSLSENGKQLAVCGDLGAKVQSDAAVLWG